MCAVDKRECRYFAAGHKLFDYKFVSGTAELLVQHDFPDAILRLVEVFADQDAFSERQPVRL